jgi:hypothetical protein
MIADTVTLFRPVGPEELELIKQSRFRAFPPRLPHQPIFYPVITEEYAIKIARDWNVQSSGEGYVTKFEIRRTFISRYEIQNAGGERYQEYWIPAAELEEFNLNIVGLIEVVRRYSSADPKNFKAGL